MYVQAPPPVEAGEAEEDIQRALYVGNYSAAVDAALQVCHSSLDRIKLRQARPVIETTLGRTMWQQETRA